MQTYMTWMDRISLFQPLDFAALAGILIAWYSIGWVIEHPSAKRPSVSHLMAQYRRDWMVQMITRQPRIFDSHMIGTLRQSTAFFASTSLIALGGTLALLGNSERLSTVVADLALTELPTVMWEFKMLLPLLFLTNGFLKFVWSNRLFGYCSVLMAAVPNDVDDPRAPVLARKAAEINITAARSFNRGLRSLYFALASLGWVIGPFMLGFAALVTVIVVWRREFTSLSRRILLEKDEV
jgi:uncharacterized membrane protein